MQIEAENLAREFCRAACENGVDMMTDLPSEYTTFASVNDMMSLAIESHTEAFLEEFLGELNDKIRNLIKATKVKVVEATFDANGIKDVDYKFEK